MGITPKSLIDGNKLLHAKNDEKNIYFEQLNKSWN